jgi:hypothetical protein
MSPTPRAVRAALAGFVLDPLPAAIRGELIRDQAFNAKLGISPEFWLPLTANVAAESVSLHNALRSAVDGQTSAVLDLRDGGREKVELRRLKGGAVALVLRGRTYSFANVDPLASDQRMRRRAVNRVLAATPLMPSEEDDWRSLAHDRALTEREYIDFMSDIRDTPEALHAELKQPQELSGETVCADDIRYFERLVGPRPTSVDLNAYIGNELLAARAELYKRHPDRALRRMGFSALWEPLLPFDLLRSIQVTDTKPLLKAEDPYTLLFGFELCRAHFDTDAQFIGLGRSFLDKLLLDDKRSMARCTVFSAAALISTVMLRRVSGVDGAPLFWTRLAGLAHAGVITDALAALPDSDDFFSWASGNFYGTYTWYSAIDRRDSPRWKPDWIAPHQVYAELVGRVLSAIHASPSESQPIEWTAAIDLVLDKLQREGTALQAFFPGPFDDYREVVPESSSNELFRKVEAKLETADKLDAVPALFALAYSTRCSDAMASHVLRILNVEWPQSITADPEQQIVYLQLCAHLAAGSRSVPIANAVINRCLFEVRGKEDGQDIMTFVGIMLEACAAMPKQEDHRRLLGTTLANACFTTNDAKDLSALETTIDLLGQRERRLIPYLAKARAIVRTKASGS